MTRPVPVPLLVSSWDASKEHVDVWLARRIHEEYGGLSRDLDRARIRELVRDRRILPVLDGLDEGSPDRGGGRGVIVASSPWT
ncbi:hypothetical protein [Streptomyces flavochromogenes]|uniref:hypothetical protein n=1 Tax=Streptomyces flavochromogenes TaxID=68199 RepID=UPI00099D6957|nr:hypothetical protein [Streptomyces flavochromogenes]